MPDQPATLWAPVENRTCLQERFNDKGYICDDDMIKLTQGGNLTHPRQWSKWVSKLHLIYLLYPFFYGSWHERSANMMRATHKNSPGSRWRDCMPNYWYLFIPWSSKDSDDIVTKPPRSYPCSFILHSWFTCCHQPIILQRQISTVEMKEKGHDIVN